MMKSVKTMALEAANASLQMASLTNEEKNIALLAIAQELEKNREKIILANEADLKKAVEDKLSAPLLKRLKFDDEKITVAIKGIKDMTGLPDPVGLTTYHCNLDDGLDLYRVTSPMGVIGIIFESRPDALVQISALCLKSANAVLLKGGSEATLTNKTLIDIISNATKSCGVPYGWIFGLQTRSDVGELLKQEGFVDLIIPRGSNEFVKMIMSSTSIPVLGHSDGICHTYIDKDASIDNAVKVAVDGKIQYPAACNATETILVHKSIAKDALKKLKIALDNAGVKIFGCSITATIIDTEITKEWNKEYLDMEVSVKVVEDIEDAIAHINKYGSGHTDAILTENENSAKRFMSLVDSASVFWNCSTRFSDGFRYGFGAEVGISTSKIHARGPVGLEGLVTYKYKLFGTGQIVDDFSSGKSNFKHIRDDAKSPFDL